MAATLRVLGLVVAGAVLVIGLAAGAVYFISDSRLNRKVDVPRESIAIPTDISAVQRGQHLASAVAACVECHGPNLAGKVFIDDRLFARIVPPNLTRGARRHRSNAYGCRLRTRHPPRRRSDRPPTPDHAL